jgi:guanyl-specific ribonuclease Sa
MNPIRPGINFLLVGLSSVGWGWVATSCLLATPVLANSNLPLLARKPIPIPTVAINQLPPQVKTTLDLIRQGGPFPYRKDGSIFSNRERRLPAASPNYYREYTVPTPGSPDRGARRLVTGPKSSEIYYTPDHYRSFVKVQP